MSKPTPDEIFRVYTYRAMCDDEANLFGALCEALRQRDEARAEVASWTRDGLTGKLAIAAERDRYRAALEEGAGNDRGITCWDCRRVLEDVRLKEES